MHATQENVSKQNRKCKGVTWTARALAAREQPPLVVVELVSTHVVCRGSVAGGVFRFGAWSRLTLEQARIRGEHLPEPFAYGEGCGLPHLPPAPLDGVPQPYRDALAAFLAELGRHVRGPAPRTLLSAVAPNLCGTRP